jgi:uncharacterized membrane protein
LIGSIAIIFAFLFNKKEGKGSERPLGWSYNPSSWTHRIPTVGLAILCWFFSRYMAAYQLGYIPNIWDPFFAQGTFHVITSDVSRAFPVSDAGLGALCYTIEALLGWQGDKYRFATMPWLVFSFAFLVIPVGAVSITLIILQPILVGAWCSWCLATALFMLIMIVLTAGEFIAMLQFVKQSKKRGESPWRVFWAGGCELRGVEAKPRAKRSVPWGITTPWNLVISAILGLGLMCAPGFLNIQGHFATNDFIAGPLVAAISVIAMAEVFRAFRFCLVLIGAWFILAPWILAYPLGGIALIHCVIGLALLVLALPKGMIKERYGRWERFII